MSPAPVKQNEPLRRRSPACLGTESDSPVSSYSSTSSPRPSTSGPSTGTRSPGASTTRSPRTIASASISTTAPWRRTRTRRTDSAAMESSATLGPQLLHDADHDVEDHRAVGEERVAEDDASAGSRAQTERQGIGERGEQGDVEDGEDVVADDVPDASRLRWRRDVALAVREPVCHLGVGEACGRVLHGAHDPGASSPRRGRRPRGSEKQGSRARRGAAGPDRARRACQHSSTVARAHSARGREPSRNAGRRRGNRPPRYNGGHAMPGPPRPPRPATLARRVSPCSPPPSPRHRTATC
jgi:hypothetical protein